MEIPDWLCFTILVPTCIAKQETGRLDARVLLGVDCAEHTLLDAAANYGVSVSSHQRHDIIWLVLATFVCWQRTCEAAGERSSKTCRADKKITSVSDFVVVRNIVRRY